MAIRKGNLIEASKIGGSLGLKNNRVSACKGKQMQHTHKHIQNKGIVFNAHILPGAAVHICH